MTTSQMWIAKRTIEQGEMITVPLDARTFSPDVEFAGTVQTHDHPDVDVAIAYSPDITPAEQRQIGEQLRTGPIVPIEIPASVKTVGDFFGEDMARSIAEQAWAHMSKTCAKCGEEKAFGSTIAGHYYCEACLASARAALPAPQK